ncbi:DNA repair protein RAD51 homolog 4 [Microplitis demolitor]|uniref:DNA repair protein RAD51 homolog 4 n=1 Tax=Microplitis demolitor TaxID=69319 RepID=UPI0004CCA6F5|nr:DNA repair protein RAD51 homolog 4 [Microplitis demolitor]XP_008543629.1 DNA repair protein RAD51 homolog 4 [Microplitis demolitor]XP_008543630.1 DNA repair protein RAD51 homolog 4 [Microplitis demolitor]
MARLTPKMFSLLNEDHIYKLHNKKIFTVLDFVSEDLEKLKNITELPVLSIENIRKEIAERFSGIDKDPLILLEQQRQFISTGIKNLDDLLSGGLYACRIYEICGKSSSGKTQLCITLAANIAINSSSDIHYIDTKKDFSATRLQSILEAKKLSDEVIGGAMERVKVTSLKNITELLTVLHNFSSSFKANNDKDKPKLIIIDSLPVIFSMLEENTENFGSLNYLANVCRNLVTECCLSIVTVNLLRVWRDNDDLRELSADDPMDLVPHLGKYWINIPNTRLFIDKQDNETREIKVLQSIDLEVNSSVQVTVDDTGFI